MALKQRSVEDPGCKGGGKHIRYAGGRADWHAPVWFGWALVSRSKVLYRLRTALEDRPIKCTPSAIRPQRRPANSGKIGDMPRVANPFHCYHSATGTMVAVVLYCPGVDSKKRIIWL